ncbi:peptidoglycan DD-metalloendopeptidase family protein [Sporosarcina sp. FSL W7-1349]|uniref:peptidoglycan DD-metalloendopeptidase family protein n=1 Tax=Sporosarcina sp. FSL W7-1349 TaxID=2921561 RepID=UPI0030FCAB6C
MFSKEVRKGNRIAKAFPKFILIAVLLTGIGLNVGFANEPEKDNLATVYHVYTNDEYIGKISDKEKIEQLKEQKLEEAATQYEDLQLKVADLSVIPEKVFETGSEDDTVLDTLQEKMAVEAEAVGILVDGEPALYVKDMDAYRNVIRDLKLQTVTEKELNAFEKRQAYNEPLPPLKENETRVADIMMSSDIQADEGQAAPEDVLNVKKAVQLLNKGTLENKKYVVQPGDVLGKIAAAHDMTTKQLLELNPDYKADTVLQLGDELNVTKFEPFVEVEAHFESKRKEPIPFKTIKEQDKTLLKGEKKVTQKGVDGEKVVTELIRKQNGEVVGRSIQEETVTAEPTDKVLVVGTKVIASRGTGSFVWPAVGGYISSHMGSRWGRTHLGIDIARPSNRTIKAADNGVVTAAGPSGAYGNRIIVSHKNGYETLYAHLSSIDVSVGQTVAQGAKIGVMGSTGRSTGVHLHFEVLKNGENINPMSVLK